MEAKASVQDVISDIALEYTRHNTCPAETYMPESARDKACLENPDITCDKCHRYAADKLAGEILDKLRPHLVEDTGHIMPEGMEWLLEVWPKWSNGEYCKFGDWWTADKYGDYKPKQLRRLVFYTPEQLREWEQDEGDNFGYEWDFMRPSDTTYRPDKAEPPAPKVLDSEGVECNVGDAVWWVRNKTGDFRIIRIDKYGKCAIHDDDADEPCGMTVPSTELTHKRPDSWERLEEDAGKEACEYFAHMPCGCETSEMLDETVEKCNAAKARDLVRRAKKLAGVSE